MTTDSSIALDALSIVYMLVLIGSLKLTQRRELLNRQYVKTMVMICAFLALDIVYLCLYGSVALPARLLLKAVKSLYFIANTAIVFLWVTYIDCILFGEQYKAPKHRAFYQAAMLLNAAMVIVNFPTGFLFEISPAGTFVVGLPAMWVFTALNYGCLLLAMAILIKNRGRVERRKFLPLLVFPLPPLLAEIIQVFFQQRSLICTYAVSALILFQVSQNSTIYTDELTGLSNRRLLNESLEKWFSEPRGAMICGLMIDLDGLKRINDTYGHVSGDKALMAMARVIKAVRRKGMVSARFGGDEFILAWLSEDGHELKEMERGLAAARAQVNRLRPEHERIDFSVGRFCCRDNGGLTVVDFIRELDGSMYQSKHEKQQAAQ